mmetsp:Transcript_38744/g.121450  ORF Transcript_38744/g.121450 Transcript_38744/m.121450 type:complete len:266 (+) Transcript_38744:754-1551(+)
MRLHELGDEVVRDGLQARPHRQQLRRNLLRERLELGGDAGVLGGDEVFVGADGRRDVSVVLLGHGCDVLRQCLEAALQPRRGQLLGELGLEVHGAEGVADDAAFLLRGDLRLRRPEQLAQGGGIVSNSLLDAAQHLLHVGVELYLRHLEDPWKRADGARRGVALVEDLHAQGRRWARIGRGTCCRIRAGIGGGAGGALGLHPRRFPALERGVPGFHVGGVLGLRLVVGGGRLLGLLVEVADGGVARGGALVLEALQRRVHAREAL